jgi:hypothetical protein
MDTSPGTGGSASGDGAPARALLRDAFADGDVMLVLNVPPTWGSASSSGHKPFAAARPGVLWPCYQVERAPSTGCASPSSRASWRSDRQDLWGRSLPSQAYGDERDAAGAFVGQDNTAALVRERQQWGDASPVSVSPPSSAADGGSASWQAALSQLPDALVLRAGTMLCDAAVAGDVEAVMARRASVVALPTWPYSHPLSLKDELGAAALEEEGDGLPLWLSSP